jgi:shikimate kinase
MKGNRNILFLVGFMGSGKTHYGKQLAAFYGVPFIDLDAFIEAEEGMTISSIFQVKGENYFREKETAGLRTIVGTFSPNIKKNHNKFPIFGVLSCGGGTPCFNGNMEWMNDHGLTVWMAPDSEVLVKRLKSETDSRPLIAGLDEAEFKRQVEDRLQARAPFYSLANLKITNPSISIKELHEQISHAQALL